MDRNSNRELWSERQTLVYSIVFAIYLGHTEIGIGVWYTNMSPSTKSSFLRVLSSIRYCSTSVNSYSSAVFLVFLVFLNQSLFRRLFKLFAPFSAVCIPTDFPFAPCKRTTKRLQSELLAFGISWNRSHFFSFPFCLSVPNNPTPFYEASESNICLSSSVDKNSEREALERPDIGIAAIWQRHFCLSIIDDGTNGLP